MNDENLAVVIDLEGLNDIRSMVLDLFKKIREGRCLEKTRNERSLAGSGVKWKRMQKE